MAMSRVRKSICLPVKKTIGNECGFSFPVTLCLLMLFVFTLSFQAAQLVAVKGFYKEILQYEKNQYYFLLALKETEKYLAETGDNYDKEGRFTYRDCTVNYRIQEVESDRLQILYSLFFAGRPEVNGVAYYDKHLKRIVKWFEKG